MKRLIVLSIALSAILMALAAGPQISFATMDHDFGNVREKDGKVECSFEYTNTGDAPLVLTTVSTPCGCAKPEFSAKPLAPGKSGVIKVTFNPSGISGEFMRTITVRTNVKINDKKQKYTLKISGAVIPKK